MKETVILTIDDDEMILYALETLFKMNDWTVISANNVKDGLNYFKRFSPDIVLMDYHMPNINGIEGVKMLRKLSPTVPIVVFTIDESQEVADEFMAAGASDFALKPIKAPDIVSRIKLHLRMARQLKDEQPFLKGISKGTLQIIEQFMKDEQEYLTVSQVAEGTGLAYQTVYRYLQHLVQDGKVDRVDIYGKVGRPKQVFRLVE